MLLFILALTTVARAVVLDCHEPDTDLLTKCNPGQALYGQECLSYFQLRSEGKKCLIWKHLFVTDRVPADEVICPLAEKTSDCSLYRAFTADCLSFDYPSEPQPPCKGYDAHGEYEGRKICAEITDWITEIGFTYSGGPSPVKLYPAVVPSRTGGLCPTRYCPTSDNKCIRLGIEDYKPPVPHPGATDGVDKKNKYNLTKA